MICGLGSNRVGQVIRLVVKSAILGAKSGTLNRRSTETKANRIAEQSAILTDAQL